MPKSSYPVTKVIVSFGATIPVAEFSNITPQVTLELDAPQSARAISDCMASAQLYIFEIAGALAQRQIDTQVEMNERTLFSIDDERLLKLRLRHTCPAFNWLCLNRKVNIQATPRTETNPPFITFNYGE